LEFGKNLALFQRYYLTKNTIETRLSGIPYPISNTPN